MDGKRHQGSFLRRLSRVAEHSPPAPQVDVLIPTFERPAALAVTLAAVAAQTQRQLRVVISDQTEPFSVEDEPEVAALVRYLRAHDVPVAFYHHVPRQGMAEQRQFLLGHTRAPYALFLDDDVHMEPDLIGRMLAMIRQQKCGFVGSALIGLSYRNDRRQHEQVIEFWKGNVRPEVVTPDTNAWQRHRLHNAANLWHVQRSLGLTSDRSRVYKVAWVGGCVLYDVDALRAVGGFDFWRELPAEHAGEDVLVQLRVMAAYGGCGLIPSGAYHLELPTKVPVRAVDAPRAVRVDLSRSRAS